MRFNKKQFELSPATGTYIQEASTLGIGRPLCEVTLVDDQGEELKFVFDKVDWADASHEDVAGWRFKYLGYPSQVVGLLIIND